MRSTHRSTSIGVVVLVAALGLSRQQAYAGTWDLNLARLCRLKTVSGELLNCGGGYSFAKHGGVSAVFPDNNAFRSLMSELGVMFAPNILAPAETLGFNGFKLGVELGFVTANTKNSSTVTDNGQVVPDANGDPLRHRYWRASEAVSDVAFSEGNLTSTAIARMERELPPSLASTISVIAKKGFWFPVPSFEIGGGIRHLINSRMFSGIVTAKLALHEGFQGLPVPALAVRGSASRVFNTPGFNLTVAGLDFSISKAFGVGSLFNLTPYLGYQLLWIVADSAVLDATPNRDQTRISIDAVNNDPTMANDPARRTRALAICNESASRDCNSLFAFVDQSDIVRHRLFFGVRAKFYVVSFLLEYAFFTEGRDLLSVTIPQVGTMKVDDESGAQHSVNLSIALEY